MPGEAYVRVNVVYALGTVVGMAHAVGKVVFDCPGMVHGNDAMCGNDGIPSGINVLLLCEIGRSVLLGMPVELLPVRLSRYKTFFP